MAKDFRHDLYLDLFKSERARREAVRGSFAVPVAAISVVLFALGNLANSLANSYGFISLKFRLPGHSFTELIRAFPLEITVIAFLSSSSILVILACYQLFLSERPDNIEEPTGYNVISQVIYERECELMELGIGSSTAHSRAVLDARYAMTEQFNELYLELLDLNETRTMHRRRAMRLILVSIVLATFGYICMVTM